MDKQQSDKPIFVVLLSLIALTPFPRGGTFDWAWLLLIVTLALLGIIWLVLYVRGHVQLTKAFLEARVLVALVSVWCLWQALQLLPVPLDWLDIIAPLSAEAYRALPIPAHAAPITVDPHATSNHLLLSLAYLVWLVLILLTVNSQQRLRQLASVIVVVGVVQALLAIAMVYSETYWFYPSTSNSAQGSFANRNQLAGFLTQTLAFGIGLLLANMRLHRSNSWRERLRHSAETMLSLKVRLRIYLAIMVITLVLTHSRMGNIAFFSSMTAAGILAVMFMKRPPKPAIILLASLLLIDLAIISQWFGLDKLQQRLGRLDQETVALDTRVNTLNRLDTSLYSRNLHRDAPLTGTGAGTFYAVFPAYQHQDQPAFYQHAHNDYLEFLTDTGWIGLLLLGLVVLLALGTAIQALRTRHSALCQGIAFSSVMGIVAILIHSAVDFNLRIPATTLLVLTLLALAYIARYLPNSRHQD
ncbi:MAG: O-antigen ligase family protein [bacterium]